MFDANHDAGKREAQDLANNSESEEIRRLATSVLALYKTRDDDLKRLDRALR